MLLGIERRLHAEASLDAVEEEVLVPGLLLLFVPQLCYFSLFFQQSSLHFEVLVFSITQPAQKPWAVCGHSILFEEKHIKTGKAKNTKNAALALLLGCNRMKQIPGMPTAL